MLLSCCVVQELVGDWVGGVESFVSRLNPEETPTAEFGEESNVRKKATGVSTVASTGVSTRASTVASTGASTVESLVNPQEASHVANFLQKFLPHAGSADDFDVYDRHTTDTNQPFFFFFFFFFFYLRHHSTLEPTNEPTN